MKSDHQKRFVIIDGNAIIHRAYHAIPPLTVKGNIMVNAVYGFTSMLLRVISDLKPDYLALSFDVAGGTFRDDLYEDYKATRVEADQDLYDQIPLVHRMVEAFGIPIFTKEGFEADDVIGTLTRQVVDAHPDIQSVVVTGDMDLLQLVDDGKIVTYLLKKGISDIALFDDKAVIEKYGFAPNRIIDYKALKGDPSDNIPGVKGIGDKTAKQLLEKVGGIDEIYAQLKDENSTLRTSFSKSVIAKLENDEKMARLSYELATIKQDVTELDFSLEASRYTPPTAEQLTPIFREFEFFSLLKRLPGAEKTEAAEKKSGKKKSKKKIKALETVTPESLPQLWSDLLDAPCIACREVLAGSDLLSDKIEGLVFVTEVAQWYLPFTIVGDKEKEQLKALFVNKEKVLLGHDVKQLVKALRWNGIAVKNRLFDVMIASYLINSSTRAHDLASILLRTLGVTLEMNSDQKSLFGVNPEPIGYELSLLFDVYADYKAQVEEEHGKGLFEKIEMALIPVLADMELHGIAVDTAVLADLSKRVTHDIDRIVKAIWKEAGEEFNVSSSVQLRDILFEKMQLPTQDIKKGKTGYSTAASELEKLHDMHPIIPLISEYRELEKLRNTYIDVLPTLINPKTGRIHSRFNQAVAQTGRLSSSDPNLQNIPIRTELGKEIRNAFIAADGYELVVLDYSQVELRIVASLAEDEKMIAVFKSGEDIHKATAAAINGVPLEEVTKEMRYAAKEVNFGVLYGMGAYGLAARTGIQQWEAKEFIKKYFEQFAGVKKYVDQTLEFAKKEGYVETLFGRRRYVPELTSRNFQLRSAGERMAINMPIQGTAADLMKLAMIRVHEYIAQEIDASVHISEQPVRLLLQVHDELVLEVKKGLGKKILAGVKEIMESVTELRVPIDVNGDVGKRWGEIK